MRRYGDYYFRYGRVNPQFIANVNTPHYYPTSYLNYVPSAAPVVVQPQPQQAQSGLLNPISHVNGDYSAIPTPPPFSPFAMQSPVLPMLRPRYYRRYYRRPRYYKPRRYRARRPSRKQWSWRDIPKLSQPIIEEPITQEKEMRTGELGKRTRSEDKLVVGGNLTQLTGELSQQRMLYTANSVNSQGDPFDTVPKDNSKFLAMDEEDDI